MKCLSIRNPWAYLIAHGIKDVENRRWSTDHRGPIGIHVSGQQAEWINLRSLPKEFQDRCNEALDHYVPFSKLPPDLGAYSGLVTLACDFYDVQDEPADTFGATLRQRVRERGYVFPAQTVIGTVDIVDVVGVGEAFESSWADKGSYNWVLANPRLYKTPKVDVKGKLGLWDLDI